MDITNRSDRTGGATMSPPDPQAQLADLRRRLLAAASTPDPEAVLALADDLTGAVLYAARTLDWPGPDGPLHARLLAERQRLALNAELRWATAARDLARDMHAAATS